MFLGGMFATFTPKTAFIPPMGTIWAKRYVLGTARWIFGLLFTKLRELGYDSYVTIEREIDGAQQDEDVLYAKAFLEKMINEVYGG